MPRSVSSLRAPILILLCHVPWRAKRHAASCPWVWSKISYASYSRTMSSKLPYSQIPGANLSFCGSVVYFRAVAGIEICSYYSLDVQLLILRFLITTLGYYKNFKWNGIYETAFEHPHWQVKDTRLRRFQCHVADRSLKPFRQRSNSDPKSRACIQQLLSYMCRATSQGVSCRNVSSLRKGHQGRC